MLNKYTESFFFKRKLFNIGKRIHHVRERERQRNKRKLLPEKMRLFYASNLRKKNAATVVGYKSMDMFY